MYKMTFTFDTDKMLREGKYNIDRCYQAMHKYFAQLDFKVVQDGPHFECFGHDDENDMADSLLLIRGLKKSNWFLDCINEWHLLDDDFTEEGEFDSEDLLVSSAKVED